jgi:broad specificity phosphatase PhoE
MIISLLRHGATEWNALARMQGRRDLPLSTAGRNEVAGWRLPATVARDARWVSSPLARAIETAEVLGCAHPLVEPALTEMDWGAWEGRTHDELRAQFGEEFTRNERLGLDFRPPGGESPRDVVTRVTRWLSTVAATGESSSSSRTTACSVRRSRSRRTGTCRASRRSGCSRRRPPLRTRARTGARRRRVQRAAGDSAGD